MLTNGGMAFPLAKTAEFPSGFAAFFRIANQ
jgi:hypothetical protein